MRKESFKTGIRKSAALGLSIAMAFSMSACGKTGNAQNGTTSVDTTDESGNAVSADTASYTYNDYAPGSPATWNPHEWETDQDSYIMTYTTSNLYEFDLNDTNDGYKVVCEMASDFPVDVTSDYAGNETYGVPSDAKEGYAWKIELNPAAKWEDGTPITADDYIYSMQQLLNSDMQNYRASSFYDGTHALANAQAFASSGKEVYTPVYDSAISDYRDVKDSDMVFSLTQSVVFFGDSGTNYYNQDDYKSYFNDADGNDLYAKYSTKDYWPLTDEAKADLLTIAANFGDTRDVAYKEFCFTDDGAGAVVDFSSVGLIKTGDYEITYVFVNPITQFYVEYTDSYLVKKDLYEKYKTTTGDITKTTYGTSVETYMSYGPYKLTEYQTDKQITMEKNDNWYGYTDGKHEGEYQTTKINCQIVSEQATALSLFLSGQLDEVQLVTDNMETYRTSDYVRYTPESYTSKLAFNSNLDSLKSREEEGKNKAILSYDDFRHAISLAIDRSEYCATCTASHKPGFGLLNDLYIYNPDTSATYRSTDEAKKVLCDVYGADDVTQITGYDKEEASKLFQSAYDEALKDGNIKDTDTVSLDFRMYQNDDAYVKQCNFVQNAINEATVGTSLEGKVTINFVEDPNYYDNAMEGNFDIIIGTWGGAEMDPWSIMQCYVDPTMKYEYGFDGETETYTVNIDGKDITKTYYDWYTALCTGEYAQADYSVKLAILSAFEENYLEQYEDVPLYYRYSASLDSQKVSFPADTYVNLVGFGGIRKMTYNYTDEEWDKYVKDNNGQLSY
jgi:oligopeptide transport system substrate-binding protein